MKFSISTNELAKLSTLVKTSQTISDVSIKATHFMFKLDGTQLVSAIYGSGNIIQFAVDVNPISVNESDKNYFNVDVNQLIQAMEKVSQASGLEEVTADVSATKITVSAGKSKIAVNLFDVLDEQDFTEAFNAIDEKKKLKFTNDKPSVANITGDVVTFLETVGKFINMIGTDRVSGLSLEGNHILYCDQAFSIIDKKVADTLTNGDKVFIPQAIFGLLSSISKLAGNYTITYSDDTQYLSVDVPTINFKSIISLPQTLCEYPEDSVLKQIKPDENNALTIDVNIKTLLMKMQMFDGVFPAAQWRWKTIEFYYVAAENAINMRYNNMCAEVDTDLPVQNISTKGTVGDFSFRLASIMVYDYLNKLVNGDTVKICVSPYSEDQEHGVGVTFDVGDFSFVTSKVVADQEG